MRSYRSSTSSAWRASICASYASGPETTMRPMATMSCARSNIMSKPTILLGSFRCWLHAWTP